MDRLRVAVIGAGVMGERHARIYASFPDVELVAVCDAREDVAHRVAAAAGAVASTDARAILTRADVEAVSVCTPDDAHRAPCVAAAAAGKHVLVEKPIAMTVADASSDTCRRTTARSPTPTTSDGCSLVPTPAPPAGASEGRIGRHPAKEDRTT